MCCSKLAVSISDILKDANYLHGQISRRPVRLEVGRCHRADVQLQEQQTFGGAGGFGLGYGAGHLGENARLTERHMYAAPVGAKVDFQWPMVVKVSTVQALCSLGNTERRGVSDDGVLMCTQSHLFVGDHIGNEGALAVRYGHLFHVEKLYFMKP